MFAKILNDICNGIHIHSSIKGKSKIRMKKYIGLLLILFLLSYTTSIQAQCIVPSTNGYEVLITITPTSIIAPGSCPYGYNYNVAFTYDISFSGNNIPSGLWTLQAEIACGSQTNFFDLPNSGGSGSGVSVSNPYIHASDCNTATVESLQCNVINLQIHGPGIASQVVDCSPVSLPIELAEFTASVLSKQQVELHWKTYSEINNDFFTVLRSQNGTQWESIADIPGAGNSSTIKSYQTVDAKAYEGLSYYRLQQTDYDGSFAFSHIVPVFISDCSASPIHYIYSATDNTLEITACKEELATLRIITMQGNDVQYQLPILFSSDTQRIFSTHQLAKGVYQIQTTSGLTRFIIQ